MATNVTTSPVLEVNGSNPMKATICVGGSVIVTVNEAANGTTYRLQQTFPYSFGYQDVVASGDIAVFAGVSPAVNTTTTWTVTSTGGFGYSFIIDVVPDPIPPTLTLSQAEGTFCAGPDISATLNVAGSAGYNCSDSYEYSVDGGTVWLPYSLGTNIASTQFQIPSIKIKAKRSDTVGRGCSAENIYTWFVESYVHDMTGPVQGSYCSIQQAIDAAGTVNGDVLEAEAHTFTLTAGVTIEKSITLKGQGYANTIVELPSTWFSINGNYGIFLNATGIKIEDIHFKVVGKGQGGILGIFHSNTEIRNNKFSGEYVFGDNEVTRATVWSANNMTGIVMDGNIIENLRQPGYLSNGSGVISDNTVNNTRGWVIEGVGTLGFTGNIFGTNISHITILNQPSINISGLTINNNDFSGTMTDWAIDNRTGQVLNATCNWFGTDDYPSFLPKNNGPIVVVPYLLTSNLSGDCVGGPAMPANLAVTYTPANEDIFIAFDVTENELELKPIPGLDPMVPADFAQIAALYQVLGIAIANNDPAAIQTAALNIGDDIITEYYYLDGSNKVYLKTIGNSDLIKQKYWSNYLNSSVNIAYPNWTDIPPRTMIGLDNYRNNTNPLTGSVNAGWLNPVLGRTLYVKVTFINNGYVNSLTSSVAIPAGCIVNTNTGLGYPTIQAAIDAPQTLGGHVIELCPGTFNETVTINKSIHLKGQSGQTATTIIAPPSTLPAASDPLSSIVIVSGSGVNAEISGLTIQGPGLTSCGSMGRGIFVRDGAYANIHDNRILDIRDNPFSGCQNGIAIQVGRQLYSTTGTATIANNQITGYQKGAIIVDNTLSSAIITGNTITGAGTSAVTAQNGVQISRGATATISGNVISGNSYHNESNPSNWGACGILLYQSGEVALTGGNNLSGNDQNYYAYDVTGILTLGNEIFGVSSAPLGFGNHIVNTTAYNLDARNCTFNSVLPSSMNITQLFDLEDFIFHYIDDPSNGFVYVNSNNTYVTTNSFSAPDFPTPQIQRGIDAASAGFTVNVRAGDYGKQIAADRTVLGVGLYQFGLFIDKDDLTIKGYKTGDLPVASASEASVLFTTESTANFGPDGVFVQSNGVTLEGLKIGDNYNGTVIASNKTIEVIGDAFTMNKCFVNTSSDQGTLYLGRWNATHPINSYNIADNIFNNCLLSINNGVGLAGPQSGRLIAGNEFTGVATPYLIGFRGWNGANPAQGWIVDPVGGAVITGNAFNNSGVVNYIIARGNSGGYDNSQFDWAQIWNSNTYGNHVVTLIDQPTFAVRAYADAAGYTETRRISPLIQENVTIGQTNDVVLVSSGTFDEDVLVSSGIKLLGQGYASTILVGQIGGDGATIRVSSPNVVIDGFGITRAGNNVTDWNNPGLNSAGVAVQGQTVFAEVMNCNLFGNRSGIDINNSNGNKIHNNLIDNNRTGLIFRNQTDNTTLEENFITNNWTIGLLFLDGSLGTNTPPQTAINSSFNNNNISGNWYGDIQDRQTGSSIPAPGLVMKNFECNWYGTTNPLVSLSNSTEPGYAAQIPVIYGGAALPPVGPQPDIMGTASANLDYISYLINGTDNNGSSLGFQPVPGSCGGSPVVISSAVPDHITCGETTGSIIVTFTGGSAPYDITWNGGSANGISSPYPIEGLSAGTYSITVSESLGSIATTSETIVNKPVKNSTDNLYFATIQDAIDASTTSNGEIITVCAGTYAENIVVSKSLTINGPNAGISPNGGIRVPEAILVPAVKAIATGEILHVAASNVTVNGFTLDGDNTALISGYSSTNGADIDAAEGVTVYETGINNLIVQNNIFRNLSYFGVTLYDYPAGVPSSGHIITDNKFQDFGTYDSGSGADFWGGGVLLYNNQYSRITNNVMTNVRLGIQTGNFFQANPGSTASQVIDNNTIEARRTGIFHNLHYTAASTFTFSNNTITALNNANETKWDGIALSSLSVPSVSYNNTINGNSISKINLTKGYEVWNVQIPVSESTISGGNVSGVDIGVFANNYEGYSSDGGDGAHATLSNLTISPNAGGTGIRLLDSPSSVLHANVQLAIGPGVIVNGGDYGLVVENASAKAISPLGNLALNGQTAKYIKLIGNANDIDATGVSFDGNLGSAMSLAQLFATEDKIDHKIDLASLGFVTVKANNAFVTDIVAATSVNNDYTRILNAVKLVYNNWSINLHGTFNWTETNAAASWALGNDGIVSPADDYAIYVPANLNGITFTAPEGLGIASITGPGDLPTANLEGVLVFDGGDNQNWTISNIEFSEFDMPIGMFNGSGGTDAFNGTTITNNRFNIAKDLNSTVAPSDPNQNIGLHFSHGVNQTISNNIFNVPGDGISNGTNYSTIVVMQSNTSGGTVYDGLKIKDNTINVTGIPNPTEPAVIRGIWENSANSDAAIEISGNVFSNLNAGNTANLNRQVAFWVTSVSGSSKKVEYKNNEVNGFNEGVAWIGGLYTSYTPPAYQTGQFPVEIKNNKFDGMMNAVVVRKAVSSTNTGSPALINDNSFTNLVSGGLAIKNEGTGNALSTCNWFGTSDGDLIPAMVSGGVTFSPWLTTGGDGAGTGFQPTGSCNGLPVVITSATPDHIICGDPNGSIEVVFSGGVANYTISWTGGTPVSGITGSPYTITGLAAGTYTVVVTDNFGSSASTDITVLYQPVFNVSLGTYHTGIQSAITSASDNNVLSVCAGTYSEDIIVNKPLDIRGPNHLINPNTGTRVAEAVIHPATSSPFGEIIKVQASNVKISGFTIDGDNPMLASGIAGTNGADLDAAEAVTVYVDNVSNLSVNNNIIKNLTYFGVTIYGASYSAPATTGHQVSNNLIQDLGTYLDPEPNSNNNMNFWGGGVLIYNSQYTRISNNVMTNVRLGVQTGNFHSLNTGDPMYQVIDGNAILARKRGIFYNLHTGNPSPLTLSNNSITALSNSNETVWDGILMGSLSEASGIAVNNTIDGSAVSVPSEGYEIWNVNANAPATITGGSVSGVDIGVFANNFEGYNGNGTSGAHGVVNGLIITTKSGGTGVKAYDSPSYTGVNPAMVNVIVQNNCTITGAANGIMAAGADASVSISNNLATISGNEVGIRVKDGADLASVTGNTITNNTHGGIIIESTAGTIGLINNNTISGNGYTVDAIHGIGLKNELSTPVDAQINWWGDASGPYNTPYNTCGTGNAVVGPVDFMPWLDGIGGSPVTMPVYNQNKDTYYCKIQDAIDDADPDNVILVDAGTYAEQLVINTPVDLRGPNFNINPNTGTRGVEAIITYPAGLTGFQNLITIGPDDTRVDVDNVKINGFIIDGNAIATTANTTGIMGNGDNLVVKNNIIRNFNYVSVWVSSYVYEGGAWIYNDYNNSASIQDNYIHNAGIYSGLTNSDIPYGIYLQGTYGTITGNKVETVKSGIQVQPYNHPNTTNLTGIVSGNSFEAYRDAMWYNYSENANAKWVFDNNTGTGIVPPTAITENDWRGFRVSTTYQGDVSFTNNTITPGATTATNKYGVLFASPSTADAVVTIQNNSVTGFNYGVYIPAGLANTANIAVEHNIIEGNTLYGVYNGTTIPVNANHNWWGSNTGPAYVGNPCGTGDAVSANVLYNPWANSNMFVFDIHQLQAYTVGGTGSICSGEYKTITLTGSQNGGSNFNYEYTLYKDGVLVSGSLQVGNGSPLSWTDITTENATYTVKAKNNLNDCVLDMNGNAKVFVGPITTISSLINKCPGSIISVPVTVESFEDVGAISLTLTYDPAKLTYQNSSIHSGLMSNFGISTYIDDDDLGIIKVSGFINGESPISLFDGEALFTMSFTFLDGPATIAFDDITDPDFCNYGSGDPLYVSFCDTPTGTYYINGTIGEDLIPPSAVCQNITIPLDAMGNATITPAQINNGSTDNCGIANLALNRTAFGCADILTNPNPVILTVTDNSGNTSTCNATVTVQDVTPPTAVCQSINVELDNTGTANISAADINNGSTDACGILSFSVSPDSFNCSNLSITPAATGLFISEYIEGSSSNKAIEIFNGTGSTVNLATENYRLITYSNGSNTAGLTINLTGTIAPGDVYVVCPTDANSTLLALADQIFGTGWFNGDDAVVLYKATLIVDIFGVIGNDPGTAWTSASNTTLNKTLRRNTSVTQGISTNPVGSFATLETEWFQYPVDEFSGLGTHSLTTTTGNPVTLTVTDVNGNSATCNATVTVQDLIKPAITCPANITRANDPGVCGALVTILPATAADNCTVASINGVRGDAQALTAVYPVGLTTITWTATDQSGNTQVCTQTITITDGQTPSITCPANVTVQVNASSNPSATGFATATDNCSATPVITFSDLWTPGSCSGTGMITRTWSATDGINIQTCVQTITIIDTFTPAITCPADITKVNDPGLCSAVATFADPVSNDPGYNEGWENSTYVSGDYIGWSPSESNVISVPSGTGGIISASGGFHGLTQNPAIGTTGVFSRIGGYNSSFGNGYRVRQAVYMNLIDPAVIANTYGWDLSCASSNQAGAHLRDFIFHTASNASGQILVAGSNNSNGTRRNDLASLNHYTINTSGWYTFEFVFRNNAGSLAVDLNLLNAGGTILWTETRSNPADLIASIVGGNRYLWFTFLEVDNLAIDNTSIERKTTVISDYASGSTFPVGTTEVTYISTDACGNNEDCTFDVVVTDAQHPTIATLGPISVNADAGVCTYSSSQLTAPPTGDNCSVANVVATPASLVLGTNTVTWTVTDGSGLTAVSTQTVTVIDAQNPTIATLGPISVNADAGVCTYSSSQLTAPATGDNCSVANVVATPASLVLGTNTVTWTVTDGSGLTAVSTQTVTVIDAQNPTIATLGPISVNADAGVCTYASSQLTAPATDDNCSVVSVVATPCKFGFGNEHRNMDCNRWQRINRHFYTDSNRNRCSESNDSYIRTNQCKC